MKSNYITLEELKNLPHVSDPPQIRFRPIPHYDAVCLAKEIIEAKGFHIRNISIKLNTNKKICMAIFLIRQKSIVKKRKQRNAIIAFNFSTSQEYRSNSYLGKKQSKTMVIVNRIPLKIHRKNKETIKQYKKEISRVVAIWEFEISNSLNIAIRLLANSIIGINVYKELFFTLGRQKIFIWQRLGWVDEHFLSFGKVNITYIRFIECFNRAVAESKPEWQLDQLYFLYRLFPYNIKYVYKN